MTESAGVMEPPPGAVSVGVVVAAQVRPVGRGEVYQATERATEADAR